jgi:hypothetical protein
MVESRKVEKSEEWIRVSRAGVDTACVANDPDERTPTIDGGATEVSTVK